MSLAIGHYRPRAMMQRMRWHESTPPVYHRFQWTLAPGSTENWGMEAPVPCNR